MVFPDLKMAFYSLVPELVMEMGHAELARLVGVALQSAPGKQEQQQLKEMELTVDEAKQLYLDTSEMIRTDTIQLRDERNVLKLKQLAAS